MGAELEVVLCWHMHQPNYRDPVTGLNLKPWTYLHAMKDYADMAAHLEAHPGMSAVVNFTPVLLDQLEAYAQELDAFLSAGTPPQDPLLAALSTTALPTAAEARMELIRACRHAHREHVIGRFEAFHELIEIADLAVDNPLLAGHLGDGFLNDLLVWYHLGWLGESVRRQDPEAQRLIAIGHGYLASDKRSLVGLIHGLISEILPRYRRLAESGQIELAVTPHDHPILPLLLDFNTASEAWPDVQLPACAGYPGGAERARWHLQRARDSMQHHFGQVPVGCWPSEGAVSEAALRLIAEAGFSWCATGQNVLRNSIAGLSDQPGDPHRPYQPMSGGPVCFFRDDDLSDTIGFIYKVWHGDDAAANLIHRLEGIAEHAPPGPVSIILDGENAWEHYPANGYYFLDALYGLLEAHPRLRPRTFAQCLARPSITPTELPMVVTGSWVYGTLSTWIGDPDKNRAWELLVAAKQAYDKALPELDSAAQAIASELLGRCESSDWFWWLGADNSVENVSAFERLFRIQLSGLYQALKLEVPAELSHVFAHGKLSGDAGSMRPAH